MTDNPTLTINESQLARIVTEAAMDVQRENGRARQTDEADSFRALLAANLQMRGLRVESRTVKPGRYGSVKIVKPETIPLIVNGLLVVDVYAEKKTEPILEAQALAKLHLTGLKMALIVNFGIGKIRDGIRRVQNVDVGD